MTRSSCGSTASILRGHFRRPSPGKKAAYAEYRKLRDEAQELSVAVRNIASLYDAELQEQQKIKEEKTH